MGCKSSKLLTASVELGDKPRRSRANLKLDLIQYLPNEPLELPAPHHDDVIPVKKTAGAAAAAVAVAAACSPRSPALTPAMTPHAEEELDPAVPATAVATIIVQQCSVASDEASEAGLLDSEGETFPGTRTKVCSSHKGSASLLRDSNEKISAQGGRDHSSKRRRESGSEGEGERVKGGGDKKRASQAGVAEGGHAEEGDGATCITIAAAAAILTINTTGAVEGGINTHILIVVPGIMCRGRFPRPPQATSCTAHTYDTSCCCALFFSVLAFFSFRRTAAVGT